MLTALVYFRIKWTLSTLGQCIFLISILLVFFFSYILGCICVEEKCKTLLWIFLEGAGKADFGLIPIRKIVSRLDNYGSHDIFLLTFKTLHWALSKVFWDFLFYISYIFWLLRLHLLKAFNSASPIFTEQLLLTRC